METLNIDNEYFDNKLKDYVEVDPKDLCVGHHFRYTKNIYKQEGRKCCYAVVVRNQRKEMKMEVKGYKSEYKPWIIDYSELGNKYKQVKFYFKKEDVDGTFAGDIKELGGSENINNVDL